jgi:hypothetical protein
MKFRDIIGCETVVPDRTRLRTIYCFFEKLLAGKKRI